jgi:hypothetical protein
LQRVSGLAELRLCHLEEIGSEPATCYFLYVDDRV